MPLKIAIADDEPIARDIMEAYVSKMPDLQLVGLCQNAPEVFELLTKEEVDVLLLDINMPEITGIELLKTLRNPPMVIFTTAYSEYAVESYELNAVDYLVKPIPFERFVKAIHKAQEAIKPAPAQPSPEKKEDAHVFVKSEGKLVKLDIEEVIYVEGMKDYVKIWTTAQPVIIHSTLKNMEEQLSKYAGFLRVNKSYIVHLSKVTELEGNMIHLGEYTVIIGTTYRDEVQKIFEQYRIS